jgi:site-specific DNA recombinase
MRVATYTRISTDEDRQPFSLGAQAERLESYAHSQDGWRILRRFTDSASGATLDRPGLRDALEQARAGVYELLLVYRVDRLSRNVRQLAQVADELQKEGVALRSATEPFDTSSPPGKMMLQMLGVFAEFERATIVERITAGMERAASQGRWVVGRVPYGYVRDRDTKLIHPHQPQSQVVRRIFSMYAEGQMGAEAIARVLNSEGHRTKNGTPFCARIVLAMLNNPIYSGKVEFQGTMHPGLHKPIVDHAIIESVQRILEERGESQALKRGHPSDYVLSGVIRCGRCRRAYIETSARGRSGLYHYYVCSTRYRYGAEFCSGDRLPKNDLEAAVIEQMQDVYRNTSLIDEAMATTAIDDGPAEDPARRLADLRQGLAGARRSLDR